MQYTAVIGAMDVEVAGLRERLQDVEEVPTKRDGLPAVHRDVWGGSVLLARCGIGKVNAALYYQYLIDHFPIAAVINSGVAEDSQPESRSNLVVSNAAMYHDFDVIFSVTLRE